MFSSLNKQTKKIIEIIDNERMRFGVIGSEILLLALTQIGTSASFILDQYGINKYTITQILDNLIILRQPTLEYTHKFQEIMLMAKNSATLEDEEEIYDDHLLFALLSTEDSLAQVIIKRLNVDVDEILDDLSDIYNVKSNNDIHSNYLFNLSKEAKLGNLNPFIGREDLVDKIIRILSKKQKNNPMLIGNAGVGKTAIIESLAQDLKNDTIYRLDLGGILAGTKYRGELEEKIVKAMEFIKENKAILFIDEIHNIVGAGSNEGSLDIANILKPYLARPDIRCIGATTLEEYYRHIDKDKALLRRFQNIYVDEPTVEETKKILKGIKNYYEDYHEVVFDDSDIDQIVEGCEMYLPMRAFPDKAIDVLDEAGARLKFGDETRKAIIIDQVVKDMSGLDSVTLEELREKSLYYEEMRPFYMRFLGGFSTKANIAKILAGPNFSLERLKEDLYAVFNFKEEMMLSINLDYYHDSASINNLIGSSKGYVGYESGGILTEHILKYPLSLICFDCFNQAHPSVKSYLQKLMDFSVVIDNKGRKVSLRNTIFVIKDYTVKKSPVGLITEEKTDKPNEFDLVLSDCKSRENKGKNCLERFFSILNRLKIELEFKDVPKSDDDLEAIVAKILLEGKGKYRLFYRNNQYDYQKIA